MQLLVKLSMNSLSGEQIRKNFEEEYACKSECSMLTEYDESVKDYWKLSNGKKMLGYLNMKKIDDENDNYKNSDSSSRCFCYIKFQKNHEKFYTRYRCFQIKWCRLYWLRFSF